jgi:hypothetical protein
MMSQEQDREWPLTRVCVIVYAGLMAAPAAADSRKGFVNQGFAGVPDAAPVKTLTVVSKKKKAEAAGIHIHPSAVSEFLHGLLSEVLQRTRMA